MGQIPSERKAGSHVKSFGWALQIIVFIFVNIAGSTGFADSSQPETVPSTATSNSTQKVPSTKIETRVRMLDSVVSYWSLRDQVGKRFDVNSFTVRVGALADPDWIKEVNEVVNQAQGKGFVKPELILTLSSTIPDALVLQKKLALMNIPTVIIELPDDIQERYENRYNARKNYGILGQVWFDTKEGFQKIFHPIKTVKNASKIIKNSVEAPSRRQVMYTGVKVAATAVITGSVMAGMIYFGNISPEFASAILLSRAFFVAATNLGGRTLNNFGRVDILNDFSLIDGVRSKAGQIFGVGAGISETQHGISSVIGEGEYFMTQDQVLINNVVQGTPSVYMSEERDKRLSERSADFWSLFTFFAISTPVGLAGSLGLTGPVIVDLGYTHITLLTAGAVAAFGGMYLGHKYQHENFEKLARAKWSEYVRIDRALTKWRREYVKREKEKEAIKLAERDRQRRAVAEVLQTYYPLTCQSLFAR